MATNNATNTANPSGVTAASYTNMNATVNAAGIITAASNGSSSGGSFGILASHTASNSATLDFAALFSSTYDLYYVELFGVLPVTNGANLQLILGTGAGPSWVSSGYSWCTGSDSSALGTPISEGTTSDTNAQVGYYNNVLGASSSGAGYSGNIQIIGTNGASNAAQGTSQLTVILSSGSNIANINGSFFLGAATYTSLRFQFSSGNIASGIIRVYGVSH